MNFGLHPPLPFIGSKLRWWRQLQSFANALPHCACVFDAFGGSFSVARILKDSRPDLVVIVNDYCHDYRQRLNLSSRTAEARNKVPRTQIEGR